MSEDNHWTGSQEGWSEIEKWRAEYDACFARFKAGLREPSNDDIQANDAAFLYDCGIKVD